MKTVFIYALCEPGTRTVRYIGVTKNLKTRLQGHIGQSSKKMTPLGQWLRGLQALSKRPDMVVLREIPNEQREIAEERFIRLAIGCGMDLVNSNGGGGGPTFHTPQTCEKISAKLRGIPLSLERRAKLSEVRTGKKYSLEHCANISKGNTGKKYSDKTKAKMSAAKLGKSRSVESVAKTASGNRGQIRSPEQRENIRAGIQAEKDALPEEVRIARRLARSEANKGENHPQFGKKGPACHNFGLKRTPEQRENIRAARLAVVARNKMGAVK